MTSTPATPATPVTPDASGTRKKLAAKAGAAASSRLAPPARVKGGGANATDSSNSGGTSPEEHQLSLRQSVTLASKFRRFYEKYERLYREISSAAEPPSKARKDELLQMHSSLREMKKMLVGGPGRA
jgi:RNA polymerase II elongation factor ELL